MNSEALILTPLDDKPIGSMAYRPDFVIPDREADRKDRHERLRAWLEEVKATQDAEGYATVPYGELISQMSSFTQMTEDWLLENTWLIKEELEEESIITAPDSFLDRSRLKMKDPIILYSSTENAPLIRTRHFKRGLVMIKFMTLMLPDLDHQEMARIGEMIDQWVGAAKYRRHLRGLLRWYAQRRRMLDKRTRLMALEAFRLDDCDRLSHQLLSMAASRGIRLSAKSLAQLDRLLQLMGHAEGDVHALLHRAQCSESAHLLPAHSSTAKEGSKPLLDVNRLKAIENDTQRVQLLLSEYFEDTTPTAAETPTATPSIKDIAQALMEKEAWDVGEIESLCTAHGLNYLHCLEQLNDLAFEHGGDTAIDVEGSTAYITPSLLESVIKQL